MNGIVAEDMKSELLSLDVVRHALGMTEPISFETFDNGGAKFRLGGAWADGLESKRGVDLVDASVSVNGKEFQLTKDAMQLAGSVCGLSKAYSAKTPAGLIQPQLDYWFGPGYGRIPRRHKLMVLGDDVGAALTKDSINPFSNLRLLEEAIDALERMYGSSEILVDRKFTHSLRRTHLRLVVPEHVRSMQRTGVDDDLWSVGVQVRNSLTGESTTDIHGYMFRWWCSNGAIDVLARSGTWSRKSDGDGDDVYSWARHAVDDVLHGLESSLDNVQSLVDIPIAGETANVLDDIFSQYKIPAPLRDHVVANMVESDQLNMYSVMNAVTQVANTAGLDPAHVSSLMAIGGELPHRAHGRCDLCHRLNLN